MKRLLKSDPATGTVQWFHGNEDGKGFTIQTQQKTDEILEANSAAYNDDHDRWGDGKLVASIPLSIWSRLAREGILYDKKALRKWLNDPDNRCFRVRPGRI